MKKTLEKLGQSTIAKLVVAAIVPGGFIVWGLYELSKFRHKKDDKKSDGKDENSESSG